MAKAYYSTVLEHPADEVWALIRPFDHYAWAGVDGETVIEDGKASDQVGAIRRVSLPDTVIRQKLLAHSDVERFYSYLFCEPAPVRNYCATLRVDEARGWIDLFEKEGFAKWLVALARSMDELRR